jgi:hypothetical protein
MRRALLLSLMALAVAAAPALAQKVTIDYAHEFDFDAVKTFTYVDTPETNAGNQLDDERIRGALINALVDGGLKQVDSGGDIAVTYHLATQEQRVFNTTTYGYGGWGAGWGGWGYRGVGMGGATTTESTYTEGTLIFDAYEPAEKKLVWRGVGTVTIKDNPEKRAQQIDNIISKLEKKWSKIHAGEGK